MAAKTKNTLRNILVRLEAIAKERPEDEDLFLDVMNVITHHVELVNQLNKISPKHGSLTQVESLSNVLFDSN
jgi:hypothetical protein